MPYLFRALRHTFARFAGSFALCLSCTLSLTACDKGRSTPSSSHLKSEEKPSNAQIGTLMPGEPLTMLAAEADDAVWGEADAEVTLVAFLDFQCRFCAEGFSTLRVLREKYSPRQLRIVFKHLPLEFHEYAVPAAVVGQVVMLDAGPQAFYGFATRTFSEQGQISFENLAKWAGEAGVDRDTYNRHVAQPEMLERIIQDVSVARRLGVEATPTFFVNGRLIAGAQPQALFDAAISEELRVMHEAHGPWANRYRQRITHNLRSSLVATLLADDPHDYLVPIDGSPSVGDATAPVTLVVFSDYECPFCKRAELTLDKVRQHYANQVRIVFKHLPLAFHESARPAALLASAVQAKSGDAAFFALSRELFAASPELGSSTLRELGKKHGLSAIEVDAALDGKDPRAAERLRRDAFVAEDVMAEGTPHFFINGKRLSGARPYDHFAALIDHELARASKLLEQGIPSDEIYVAVQKDAQAPGAPKRIEHHLSSRTHPTRGPSNAPVVIHLFSDFECPYCRLAEQNLTELIARNPGKIRVVWHDFPLPFHERALPLARIGRAAYELSGDDAFWRVHDAIFALDQEKPRLDEADLSRAPELKSLPWDQISAAAHQADPAWLTVDQAAAKELGISGTPAMVMGDYLVTGARPVQYLERVLELIGSDAEAGRAPAH